MQEKSEDEKYAESRVKNSPLRFEKTIAEAGIFVSDEFQHIKDAKVIERETRPISNPPSSQTSLPELKKI
jgi:hypothetical protein